MCLVCISQYAILTGWFCKRTAVETEWLHFLNVNKDGTPQAFNLPISLRRLGYLADQPTWYLWCTKWHCDSSSAYSGLPLPVILSIPHTHIYFNTTLTRRTSGEPSQEGTFFSEVREHATGTYLHVFCSQHF